MWAGATATEGLMPVEAATLRHNRHDADTRQQRPTRDQSTTSTRCSGSLNGTAATGCAVSRPLRTCKGSPTAGVQRDHRHAGRAVEEELTGQAAWALPPLRVRLAPASQRDDRLAQGEPTIGQRVGPGVVSEGQTDQYACRFELAQASREYVRRHPQVALQLAVAL